VIHAETSPGSFGIFTLYIHGRVCSVGALSHGSHCVLFIFSFILHMRFLFDYDTHLSVEA
jgi:hypothetical protein